MKLISKFIQILILPILLSCNQKRMEYTLILEKEETILSAEYRIEIERLPHSAIIFFSKQAYVNRYEFIKDSIQLSINSNVIEHADFIVNNRGISEKEEKNKIYPMHGTTYKFYIKKPGENVDSLFIYSPWDSNRYKDVAKLIKALDSSYQENFNESLNQIHFK